VRSVYQDRELPRWLIQKTDAFFDNVCELDLVFNFYKVRCDFDHSCRCRPHCGCQVYAILDEIFLAGEIEETSKDVVLSRLETLEKLE
jgi:AP-2 complex subunit sigma-1